MHVRGETQPRSTSQQVFTVAAALRHAQRPCGPRSCVAVSAYGLATAFAA
jgi:hypothetical protein